MIKSTLLFLVLSFGLIPAEESVLSKSSSNQVIEFDIQVNYGRDCLSFEISEMPTQTTRVVWQIRFSDGTVVSETSTNYSSRFRTRTYGHPCQTGNPTAVAATGYAGAVMLRDIVYL